MSRILPLGDVNIVPSIRAKKIQNSCFPFTNSTEILQVLWIISFSALKILYCFTVLFIFSQLIFNSEH